MNLPNETVGRWCTLIGTWLCQYQIDVPYLYNWVETNYIELVKFYVTERRYQRTNPTTYVFETDDNHMVQVVYSPMLHLIHITVDGTTRLVMTSEELSDLLSV